MGSALPESPPSPEPFDLFSSHCNNMLRRSRTCSIRSMLTSLQTASAMKSQARGLRMERFRLSRALQS